MKIPVKQRSYDQVMAMKRPEHRKPLRPLFLLQIVVRILAIFDLLPTKFTYRAHGMEKIGKKEPCLILMNHSSFIDLRSCPGSSSPSATPLCVLPMGL